ncbi:hypothetical protein [Actimicrobium antarcticum]|uniref:Lipoprotein n=1 Tax=Actimicrobium antarcticum TaxID=1051899 RepID=A0ABP7TZB1_9BURK
MNAIALFQVALLASVLAGCNKKELPVTPEPSTSVATPAAQLPVQPAAMAPQNSMPATSDSGNANGPSQASPSTLTNAQESSAMPLPGQANDHSTTVAPVAK